MKKIEWEELRGLCIKNSWFTEGTNGQYEKLREMAKSGVTAHDLALVIYICSDYEGEYEPRDISKITDELYINLFI